MDLHNVTFFFSYNIFIITLNGKEYKFAEGKESEKKSGETGKKFLTFIKTKSIIL